MRRQAGLFGKIPNAGENRRRQEKRKTKYETIDSIKESVNMSLQGPSRAIKTDTVDITHLQGRQELELTQWHLTHRHSHLNGFCERIFATW